MIQRVFVQKRLPCCPGCFVVAVLHGRIRFGKFCVDDLLLNLRPARIGGMFIQEGPPSGDRIVKVTARKQLLPKHLSRVGYLLRLGVLWVRDQRFQSLDRRIVATMVCEPLCDFQLGFGRQWVVRVFGQELFRSAYCQL